MQEPDCEQIGPRLPSGGSPALVTCCVSGQIEGFDASQFGTMGLVKAPFLMVI